MPEQQNNLAANTTRVVTTPLTPNSQCIATGSGDSNCTTTLQFGLVSDGSVCWSTEVSVDQRSSSIVYNTPCSMVTFDADLAVVLVVLGENLDQYEVNLDGNITDEGKLYWFGNTTIYRSEETG